MTGASDVTGMLDKYGVIFPIVKALFLGSMFGNKHRRQDGEDGGGGVCVNEYADCGSWWDHLNTANSYDGGRLSRTVAEERRTR